jgi:flagellar biosynthesis/type III secretory pathway M-ring protein FliF/YscJ
MIFLQQTEDGGRAITYATPGGAPDWAQQELLTWAVAAWFGACFLAALAIVSVRRWRRRRAGGAAGSRP